MRKEKALFLAQKKNFDRNLQRKDQISDQKNLRGAAICPIICMAVRLLTLEVIDKPRNRLAKQPLVNFFKCCLILFFRLIKLKRSN